MNTTDKAPDRVALATTAWLAQAAFNWFQRVPRSRVTTKRSLQLPSSHVVPTIRWYCLYKALAEAYDLDVDDDLLTRLVKHLERRFQQLGSRASTLDIQETPSEQHAERELRARQHEFVAPYVGGHEVVERLKATILSFFGSQPSFSVPFLAIVQSAGFGKSKLLYELARRSRGPDRPRRPTADNARQPTRASMMRVLYVCVREQPFPYSLRFPVATPCLHGYLFPEDVPVGQDALEQRLCHLFEYALAHWDVLGDKWLALFTDRAADRAVFESLRSFAGRVGAPSRREIDTASPKQHRVLVLAVDEARTLLTEACGQSWLHSLRVALPNANRAIKTRFGAYAGIAVVVADADPTVAHCALPTTQENRSNLFSTTRHSLAPPCVMTDTIDTFFDDWIRRGDGGGSATGYRDLVVGPQPPSEYLVRMGRPLWWTRRAGEDEIVTFAAKMFLAGDVAAMLCCVGLCATFSSPLAARSVADGMATLTHVRVDSNDLVTVFSSEPMLAFGAAEAWYASAPPTNHHAVLETSLLPALKEAVLLGDTDPASGVGPLVARVVLLLAMDTVSALGHDGAALSRAYKGSFHSVSDLMRVLGGNTASSVHRSEKNRGASLEVSWARWHVGFAQFVELTQEPTRETLWAMLARRTAGVLRRSTSTALLVIPIFQHDGGNEPRISMMLVHATVRSGQHRAFPMLALTGTHPGQQFRGELNALDLRDVVRVCISVGDTTSPERFYVEDGLCGLETYVEDLSGSKFPPMMSKGVAEELASLVAKGHVTAEQVE